MSPRMVIAGVLQGRRHDRRPACDGSVLDASVGRPVRVRVSGEGALPVGVGARVTPLAGPLERRPVVDRRTAAGMLLAAVDGLPLGSADTALIARWTDVLDPADAAVLASLLERARHDGPSARMAPARTGAEDEDLAGERVWVPVCASCGLRPMIEPVTLDEAESLARAHDRIHHGGAWTCEVVPASAGGEAR